MNILVSACLFGIPCKYTGGHNQSTQIYDLKESHTLILVCPEQLGGLSTPRPPAEIQVDSEGNLSVRTDSGTDVTAAFESGAQQTLTIARAHECPLAILKARSPSCGARAVYDGSFSGTLRAGEGITAALLREHGIAIVDETDDLQAAIAALS